MATTPTTWTHTKSDAWIGLLETHKFLTRALESALEARHGLSLSSVETLGRLAAAGERRMGLSALAAATGLSLSRMSRIVDFLEQRGLVERRPAPDDARAVEAHLTDAGLALARAAHATHAEGIQRLFFDHLSADELSALAAVFGRLAPRAAAACTPR
jgi:DNA-binding MarR family transcriptional regulator